MKKALPLIALVAIVILIGCNNKKAGSSNLRVKKIASGSGYSSEYFYSADGNIDYSQTSNHSKITYRYTANTVIELVNDSMRGVFDSSIIYLSKDGIADSSVANNANGSFLKTYVHDKDGYIIESRDYASGVLSDISNSTIKDGNVSEMSIADSSGKKIFTVFFEYYPDKENTLVYENFGLKFLGKDSKNLMKKFVQVLTAGDTLRMSNFTYNFDKEGRAIQKVTHDKTGAMVDSTNYTYY